MHQSIATIDSPQFINLQPLDINPLMSACEIKVLYLGENRNHSYISKDVATEMAKTLRGAPIVGYYKEDKEDFGDHGERVIIEGGEIKFECMTVPYGFVSPDAQVWFQTFEDTDDFGNTVEREYLMTTGYIWSGQFEEAKSILEEGRPHSMEIDNVNGHWETNSANGMDFYIISDATFSKLCVLGDDVEPCFEGSRVTAPEVSTSFTKVDDNFKKTLFNMMQDLCFALEGGKMQVEENVNVEENFTEIQDNVVENDTVEIEESTEDTTTTFSAEETSEEVAETAEVAEEPTEFACKEDDEEKKNYAESDKKDDEEEEKSEDEKSEEKEESKESDKEEEDKDKKYSLLEQKYEELEAKFNEMNEKYQALVEFKSNIEDAEKVEMIDGFYMLNEAEKKEIMDTRKQFSLDEIESKLSVLYTRKQRAVEMEQRKADETAKEVVTTYNIKDEVSNAPAWFKAAKNVEKQMN